MRTYTIFLGAEITNYYYAKLLPEISPYLDPRLEYSQFQLGAYTSGRLI